MQTRGRVGGPVSGGTLGRFGPNSTDPKQAGQPAAHMPMGAGGGSGGAGAGIGAGMGAGAGQAGGGAGAGAVGRALRVAFRRTFLRVAFFTRRFAGFLFLPAFFLALFFAFLAMFLLRMSRSGVAQRRPFLLPFFLPFFFFLAMNDLLERARAAGERRNRAPVLRADGGQIIGICAVRA